MTNCMVDMEATESMGTKETISYTALCRTTLEPIPSPSGTSLIISLEMEETTSCLFLAKTVSHLVALEMTFYEFKQE